MQVTHQQTQIQGRTRAYILQHPDLSECDEVRNLLTMNDVEFDLLSKEKVVKDTSMLGIELQPHEHESYLLILKMANFNLQRIERESGQTTARHQAIDLTLRRLSSQRETLNPSSSHIPSATGMQQLRSETI